MKRNFKFYMLLCLVLITGLTVFGCASSAGNINSNVSEDLSSGDISASGEQFQVGSDGLTSDPSSILFSGDTLSMNSSAVLSSQVSSKSKSVSVTIAPTLSPAPDSISIISSTPKIINAMIAFYDGNKVYKVTNGTKETVFAYCKPDGQLLVSKLDESYNSQVGSLGIVENVSRIATLGVGPNIFYKNNLALFIKHTTQNMNNYSPPYLYKANMDGSNNVRFTEWNLYVAFMSGDYIYANALNKSEMFMSPVINSNTITTGVRVNINDFSCKVFGDDIRFIKQNSCFTNDDYVLYTKFSNRQELYLLNNKTEESIKITDKGYSMTAIINGYLLYQDENNDVRAIALSDCGKKTSVVISKTVGKSAFGTLNDEYYIDLTYKCVDDAFFNGGYTCKYFLGSMGEDMKVVLFSGKTFLIKDAKGLKPLFVVGNNLYLFKAHISGPKIQNAQYSDIVAYDIQTGLQVANSGIATATNY